jgi:hypothetical protein
MRAAAQGFLNTNIISAGESEVLFAPEESGLWKFPLKTCGGVVRGTIIEHNHLTIGVVQLPQ